MSLALLWPAALLGGLALLLPLLLHRLPRHRGRHRSFAALRFIGRHSAPRRDAQISEWPLLLLRVMLLSTLVLWLALPQWRDWPGRGLQWQAVWPGVSPAAVAEAAPSDRSVWLAPGFPPTADGPAPGAAAPSASLLRELASTLPRDDRLRVLVPTTVDGMDGRALTLGRAVDWQVVAADSPRASAARQRARLAVRVEDQAESGRWLDAALDAWQADPALATDIERGPAEQAVPATADALLWIGDHPTPLWQGAARPWLQVPTTVSADARTVEPDPLSGLPWLAQPGRGARLPAPLRPAAMPAVLDADFPQRLHHLVFHREPAPSVADAASLVPVVNPLLLDPRPLPLDAWLALIAALLFLAERWLASGRRLDSSTP